MNTNTDGRARVVHTSWRPSLKWYVVFAVAVGLLNGRISSAIAQVTNDSNTPRQLSQSDSASSQMLEEHAKGLGTAKPPTEVDPFETLQAVDRAGEIWDEILRINKNNEEYPEDLVGDLFNLYHYGVGMPEQQGNETIIRKYCRPYVLGRLSQLFSVKPREQGEPPPPEDEPQNPLDPISAKPFRDGLVQIIRGAYEDLTFVQRTRLYNLAVDAFEADKGRAILALKNLEKKAESDSETVEASLIRDTIERIEGR